MRIGVLYPDGSLNVMHDREGEERAEREARAEVVLANKGESNRAKLAKLVSVDLMDTDVVEIA